MSTETPNLADALRDSVCSDGGVDPTTHTLVSAMGLSWDEAGRRPPRNWTYRCSCGHAEHGIKGQIETYDAFDLHRQTVEAAPFA